jgi:hypothetical protein
METSKGNEFSEDIKKIEKVINSIQNLRQIPAAEKMVELLENRWANAEFDTTFPIQKLKDKILERDLMEEKCNLCGFSERRVLDFKMPLIMSFKNGDKRNWVLHNLQLLCYNCYFLTIGNVFTDRDMQQLEETKSVSKTTDAVDFQLDDYHLTRLKEIGLYEDPKNDDDPYDLVSYSK